MSDTLRYVVHNDGSFSLGENYRPRGTEDTPEKVAERKAYEEARRNVADTRAAIKQLEMVQEGYTLEATGRTDKQTGEPIMKYKKTEPRTLTPEEENQLTQLDTALMGYMQDVRDMQATMGKTRIDPKKDAPQQFIDAAVYGSEITRKEFKDAVTSTVDRQRKGEDVTEVALPDADFTIPLSPNVSDEQVDAITLAIDSVFEEEIKGSKAGEGSEIGEAFGSIREFLDEFNSTTDDTMKSLYMANIMSIVKKFPILTTISPQLKQLIEGYRGKIEYGGSAEDRGSASVARPSQIEYTGRENNGYPANRIPDWA